MTRTALLSLAAALLCARASAAEADREIAQQSQNAFAYAGLLAAVDDVNGGLGLEQRTQNVTTATGTIPFTTSWLTATARLSLPLVWQPVTYASRGGQYGLGDFDGRLYALPGRQGSVSWGLGPAVRLPTATDSTIGQHVWSVGVAGGLAVVRGPWVLALEAQNLWSVLGPSSRPDVNELELRPLVALHLPGGWYLLAAPVIVANWEAAAADRWTVPLGAGAGKVLSWGSQRITLGVEAYAPVVHPGSGDWADWTIRARVGLPFPVQ
jgi:hypothetical protein